MDRETRIAKLQAEIAEELLADVAEKLHEEQNVKSDRKSFVDEFIKMSYEGYDFSILKNAKELVQAIEHNVKISQWQIR